MRISRGIGELRPKTLTFIFLLQRDKLSKKLNFNCWKVALLAELLLVSAEYRGDCSEPLSLIVLAFEACETEGIFFNAY